MSEKYSEDKVVIATLEQHDSKLKTHDAQLKVQAEQIRHLQDNAIKLENVVMAENRETRLTITQTNHQLHELIHGLIGYKKDESNLSHRLSMAKIESIVKIIGVLAGSGGILYYIFGQ